MQGLAQVQRDLIPTAQTIVDAGAGRGDTIRRYRSWYPGAQIHGFEPNPVPWQNLVKAFGQDSQCTLHHKALWSESGEITLHFGHSTPGTASVFQAKGWPNPRAVLKPALALDDYATQQGIKQIDILKMDVQGGEKFILEGAQKLLEESRIRLVVAEILFAPLYEGGTRWWELGAFLESCGYALFTVDPSCVWPRGMWGWGDAIFIPEAMLKRLSPVALDSLKRG